MTTSKSKQELSLRTGIVMKPYKEDARIYRTVRLQNNTGDNPWYVTVMRAPAAGRRALLKCLWSFADQAFMWTKYGQNNTVTRVDFDSTSTVAQRKDCYLDVTVRGFGKRTVFTEPEDFDHHRYHLKRRGVCAENFIPEILPIKNEEPEPPDWPVARVQPLLDTAIGPMEAKFVQLGLLD